MYEAAKEVVGGHLEEVAVGEVHAAWQELVNAPGTRDYEKQDAGVRFLKVVRDAWEDHILCMGMIRDVLMYLVLPPCSRSVLMAGSNICQTSQESTTI